MEKQFIDREQESSAILRIINECKLNTVIITASRSGIGKSTLSEKISYSLPLNMQCISVHARPINDAQQRESEYLDSIFSSFFDCYNSADKKEKRKNQKKTFRYFVNKKCKETVKKEIRKQQLAETLTATTSNLGMIFLLPILIIKKLFKLDYYDFSQYLFHNRPEVNLIKAGYVRYLLGLQSHCVIIDNFQNIDGISYKFLGEWLCDSLSNKNVFIFEYTLDDSENFEKIIKLRDNLSITGANVVIYKLEKMCPEFAFETILNKYPSAKCDKDEIIKYYNYSANGNIRKIEDYVLCSVKNSAVREFDPAKENISSLCNESKLIFAIISLHRGKVNLDCIYDIFKSNNISFSHDLTFCIEELTGKYHFVEIINNQLIVVHASILDAWNEYSKDFPTHCFIAYRELETYYKNTLDAKDEIDVNSVQVLLDLYLRFDPIKIYNLLSYLKKLVYDNISTKHAWEYLYAFIKAIRTKINMFVSALYEIIEWCCDLELIHEAGEILTIIETQTDFENSFRYAFSFCKINYLLGNFDTVIEYANQKKRLSKSDLEVLYYNLFLIIAYRSTNNYQKMDSVVKLIDSNESNKSYSAYGFFLRLAEVYMGKEICSSRIEESVTYFNRIKNTHQSAKSNISLSYIYAINGKTKAALKALSTAEQALGIEKSISHIFKVNKACINMLEGNIDYSVWTLLDSAELVTENDFSRLAIINNKIICCIEGINIQQKSFLEHKAHELLRRVPDKHMHAILNYNLYLLYKDTDFSKAQTYFKLAEDNHKHCETLSIRLGKNQKQRSNISNYLLTKPWHVCFLSCWEFDFIQD